MNPFRYRGYYYDSGTELYYLRSRYYNPEWGRFLNADAYVDTEEYGFGGNMFAYCGNEPIGFADPNGYDCYYFYYSDFWAAAEIDKSQLMSYFGLKKSKTHMQNANNREDFIKYWNNMGDNGESIQAVVCLFHGNPQCMIGLSLDDIYGLERKQAKCLILLSCNTGHLDYFGDNVASAFSFILENGAPVLAPDGSNRFNTLWGKNREAVADQYFNNWVTSDRDNVGWVLHTFWDGWFYGEWGILNKKATLTDMLKAINKYYKRFGQSLK